MKKKKKNVLLRIRRIKNRLQNNNYTLLTKQQKVLNYTLLRVLLSLIE